MKISADTGVLVTGGASGLGLAVVEKFVSLGAKVAIFDMNEDEGLKIAAKYGVAFKKVDVSDPKSVSEGLSSIRESIGQESVCVNCAGIGFSQKTVSKGRNHQFELFDKTIRINLVGTFNVASQSAKGMSEQTSVLSDDQEKGVIINTASVAAFDGQIGQIAYSASKGGVVGMTLPMARDLAQNGIRVVTIAPGLFSTPMLKSLPEDVQDALGKSVPFPPRLGAPSEFAHLSVQIVENSMLNGETIRLDGAIRMAPK
ncbi:SDR family NAD(P)-dependent oxidoreductase [Paracoccaceae bacterium]|jgi:NAD(P)-dependent dehydrogenase (short-subunit alcohol dehydrogenase family)|nr:SDR family NAD(P)-dependent oxidoreductase [Paracoccaceae bacterium]